MYDVIVVGGGPAGSTTAYLLAKSGHGVLLLERAAYPRRKPCGAGLSKRALKLLRELGLYSREYIVHEVEESVVVFHKVGAKFVVKAGGALTTREMFDKYLAERAQEAGAELHVLEPARTVRVGDRYVEVATPKGTYRGRAIVLACGQPNSLAARLSIKPKLRKAFAYEFDADIAEDLDPSHVYFYMNLESNMMGYFWAFPKATTPTTA